VPVVPLVDASVLVEGDVDPLVDEAVLVEGDVDAPPEELPQAAAKRPKVESVRRIGSNRMLHRRARVVPP
jgi:hypothetical protein